MEKLITELLTHMARAHEELASILHASREITMHTAQELVGTLPQHGIASGKDAVLESALALAGSVVAYLNSIGDLQEALADSLDPVMEQLHGDTEEE
jgi:predicted transcriptional regulator YheO